MMDGQGVSAETTMFCWYLFSQGCSASYGGGVRQILSLIVSMVRKFFGCNVFLSSEHL